VVTPPMELVPIALYILSFEVSIGVVTISK
jgi:hypothetical protein